MSRTNWLVILLLYFFEFSPSYASNDITYRLFFDGDYFYLAAVNLSDGSAFLEVDICEDNAHFSLVIQREDDEYNTYVRNSAPSNCQIKKGAKIANGSFTGAVFDKEWLRTRYSLLHHRSYVAYLILCRINEEAKNSGEDVSVFYDECVKTNKVTFRVD
ncbi:hypothetical protein [Catenovulum agarivorans]|uniref:hypothetical protein n=1 Tax=Catenovulum agarivorans TaxID=1172192 RepID=UPI00037B492E|nr:hypothetical protein [Catenovulum agarivorans]